MSKHKSPPEMVEVSGTAGLPPGNSFTIEVKKPKPPGHEETMVNGMQAELVVFNQRCTRMEKVLDKANSVNSGCVTFAVIVSILALALSATAFVIIILREVP